MSDIFLSYTQADREIAALVVARLRTEGWTVFWDQDIPAMQIWEEVIEREAKTAGCLVVLWSENSGKSDWVREEVHVARKRDVLLVACLDSSDPPFGYATLQVSRLAGWDGVKDSSGIQHLIRGIATLIGSSKPVTIMPMSLAIVVSRPKTWRVRQATVNIDCEFGNAMNRTVSIQWLELNGTGPNERSYHFVLNLFYDIDESRLEHSHRNEPNESLEVPVEGLESGVQFHVPPLAREVSWPVGEYAFQIRAWVDRNHALEPANVRTDFQIEVTNDIAEAVSWLMEADDETWERLHPTDDAAGIPVVPINVQVGLPATC